ncbi:hypothetical protein PIB30_001723 [Stylosanthes scabra]|uniref:Uncharacterized protein n=1 Tax=Stylosanthes scabra TaxID=79078 RepID=A0ABU6U1K4_9FABA|nr:hypothetical protein [Stylosanthes scabra]
MPEGYGRRRGASRDGRGGRGRMEGGDTAPTQQTHGGASTSLAVEVARMSTQADLPSTPQTQGTAIPSSLSSPSQQAFLDGLSSPGFQQMISGILQEGDGSYRPDTTPPLAEHVPGGSWEVPFMEPARLLAPLASPAPAEQSNEPAARGRDLKAPRRRGCGTGGHM